jgi:hypothetical protein
MTTGYENVRKSGPEGRENEVLKHSSIVPNYRQRHSPARTNNFVKKVIWLNWNAIAALVFQLGR